MPTTSSRALGVMLSGAALAGWLAGSTLNPPVAETQTAPPRPAPAPTVSIEAPHVAWPTAPRRVVAPAPSRNPFAFRADSRVADLTRHAAAAEHTAAASSTTAASAPEPAPVDAVPAPSWRLSGIAASENGDMVAVISGGGDVFLMRAGDTLPGGDQVIDVGPSQVVVGTAAGSLTLRLP